MRFLFLFFCLIIQNNLRAAPLASTNSKEAFKLQQKLENKKTYIEDQLKLERQATEYLEWRLKNNNEASDPALGNDMLKNAQHELDRIDKNIEISQENLDWIKNILIQLDHCHARHKSKQTCAQAIDNAYKVLGIKRKRTARQKTKHVWQKIKKFFSPAKIKANKRKKRLLAQQKTRERDISDARAKQTEEHKPLFMKKNASESERAKPLTLHKRKKPQKPQHMDDTKKQHLFTEALKAEEKRAAKVEKERETKQDDNRFTSPSFTTFGKQPTKDSARFAPKKEHKSKPLTPHPKQQSSQESAFSMYWEAAKEQGRDNGQFATIG